MRQRASDYNRTTLSSPRLSSPLLSSPRLAPSSSSSSSSSSIEYFSPLMTNDKVYFCAISETSFSPLCSRSLTLLIEGGQRKGGGGFLDDYLQMQMRITLCTPYSNLLFVSSLPHSVPSFCPPPLFGLISLVSASPLPVFSYISIQSLPLPPPPTPPPVDPFFVSHISFKLIDFLVFFL